MTSIRGTFNPVRSKRLVLCLVQSLVLALSVSSSGSMAAGNRVDVRLIVDVSARMANADPAGDRARAVGLLLELLPEGSDAGVWTYARYVNMLVKHGRVDESWRARSRSETALLPASGEDANLLAAVEAASWDLPGNSTATSDSHSSHTRHLIILSDGGLRSAAGADADQGLRQRLKTRLADLVAAGFVVHGLQLQSGDAGESGLLRQMALASGGVYLPVADIDNLSGAFMRVFQTVARPLAMPVRAEAFQVDAGVDELTVWRPRSKSDPQLKLVDPQGITVDRAKLREGVRWHDGGHYDLVTVQRPVPGRWHFAGGTGAAARVYALGDLELQLHGIPATVFPGMLKTFELQLASRGKPVTDTDFLELLDIRAAIVGDQGAVPVIVEDQGGGRYQLKLLALEKQGEHEVRVQVTGPTFSRELVAAFTVRNPVALSMVPQAEGTLVWLELSTGNVDYESLSVSALARHPPAAGKQVPVELLPTGLWKMRLPESRGALELTIDIEGNYLNKSPFRLKTEPIVLSLPLRAPMAVNLDLSGAKVGGNSEVGQRFRTGSGAADGNDSRLNGQGAGLTGGSGTDETPGVPSAGKPGPVEDDRPIPLWFAALLGLINLVVGLSVWLMLKVPGVATAFAAELEALRALVGDPSAEDPDPEGAAIPAAG